MRRTAMGLWGTLGLALALGWAGCGGSGSSGGGSSAPGLTTPGPLGGTSAAPSTPPSAPPSTTPGTGTPPATTPGTGGSGGVPGEFTLSYQGRDYFLYVPPAYTPSQPMPVALAFHGAGDSSANFSNTMRASGWLNAAAAEEFILVVPATQSPLSSFGNWSGNPNNDIPQMQAEMSEVLDLLHADVGGRYNLATQSIHALGFSDGGLFLAVTGLPHADLATNAIFGYGWGAFYPTPVTRKGPVQMICGTQDGFFAGAQASEAFLRGEGHEVRWEPVAGVGHRFSLLSTTIDPATVLDWMDARPLGGSGSTGSGSTGSGSTGSGSTGSGSTGSGSTGSGSTGSGSTGSGSTGSGSTASGSGGSGGALGQSTRTITTPAQAGVPSATVDYDVYVPASYDPAVPTPVVYAANVGLAPWRALADTEGFIVVDFRDHDRNGGFNFNIDVLSLNEVIGDVEGAYNADTRRRYFHGFSAGGHWGYAVVLANANSFAGLGINAGALQAAAIPQGVFPAGVQRPIPVAIRHGTTDAVVPVAAARSDRTNLINAGHPVELQEFAGGHTVSPQDAQAIWTFLRSHRAP